LAAGGEDAADRFAFGAPPGLVPPGSGQVWQPPPLLPPLFLTAKKERPRATQTFIHRGQKSYATVSADLLQPVLIAIRGIRNFLAQNGAGDEVDNLTVSRGLWNAASSALHRAFPSQVPGNPFLESDVSGQLSQRRVTEIRLIDPVGRVILLTARR
jgi:hypothetical protein